MHCNVWFQVVAIYIFLPTVADVFVPCFIPACLVLLWFFAVLCGSNNNRGTKIWIVHVNIERIVLDEFSKLVQHKLTVVLTYVYLHNLNFFINLLCMNCVNFIQVCLDDMVKAGVHCVKPEFIAVYLTDDPPPCATLHYIPEVSALVR